jgi:murein DD-endopeptidase MepM/ murein hydrolase activator NlpD
MALTASLLGGVFAAPRSAAAAEDDHTLSTQKDRLDDRISNRSADLHEISSKLVKATLRVEGAVRDLKLARVELSTVREQVRQAKIFDRLMQSRLEVAVLRLEDAEIDLVQGRQDVGDQRQAVTSYAVSTFQSGDLASSTLDIAFEATTPEDVFDEMQAASTVLDKQEVDLQELQAAEVLLQLTEERVAATKVEVTASRVDAADSLENKQTLKGQAVVAKQRVAARVTDLRATKQLIASAKRHEIKRIAKLEKERDRVQDRLRKLAQRRARQARVEAREARVEAREARVEAREARVEAREARQARQARQARVEARQAREASQARVEARQARVEARQARVELKRLSQPPSTENGDDSGDDGGYLGYPVSNSYITSSYGMRLHPILRVYKLHDGTDFGAGCGTPVYAAASGRVISEYYNAGYGNRIILDHGVARGVSLQTSYNHLTSFVAGPGQYVEEGQVIGYAGTTGYSTGCHLHFMVYVNGYTVDPVNWL